MTDELLEVHRRTKSRAPRSRSFSNSARRDFWLAACQKTEQAWESNGQGDFTRLVAPLFTERVRSLNYAGLQAEIDALFAANPRQHPLLDCDMLKRKSKLFTG
jgi:hypothetical protein